MCAHLIAIRRKSKCLNDGDRGHLRVSYSDEKSWLRMDRGQVTIFANLGKEPVSFDTSGDHKLILASEPDCSSQRRQRDRSGAWLWSSSLPSWTDPALINQSSLPRACRSSFLAQLAHILRIHLQRLFPRHIELLLLHKRMLVPSATSPPPETRADSRCCPSRAPSPWHHARHRSHPPQS